MQSYTGVRANTQSSVASISTSTSEATPMATEVLLEIIRYSHLIEGDGLQVFLCYRKDVPKQEHSGVSPSFYYVAFALTRGIGTEVEHIPS